jgi:hypothetical protein
MKKTAIIIGNTNPVTPQNNLNNANNNNNNFS